MCFWADQSSSSSLKLLLAENIASWLASWSIGLATLLAYDYLVLPISVSDCRILLKRSLFYSHLSPGSIELRVGSNSQVLLSYSGWGSALSTFLVLTNFE